MSAAPPELEPQFPLPAPGDQVLVLVGRDAPAAPRLVSGHRLEWCPVARVRTGPYDLFPVTVRLPGGGLGSYQQGEIRGWRQAPAPRRVLARLRWLW